MLLERGFELAGMTHVFCRRTHLTVPGPMDDEEVEEIVDEEKDFVANLNEKTREVNTGQETQSIEESWLGMIIDFRTPDEPFKREKYWVTWGSIAGNTSRTVPLTSSAFMDSHPLWMLYISRVEEEDDQYWTMSEAKLGINGPKFNLLCMGRLGVPKPTLIRLSPSTKLELLPKMELLGDSTG